MTGVQILPMPDPRFEEALLHFRQADYAGALRLWRQMAEEGLEFPDLQLYLHAAEVEFRRVMELVDDLAGRMGGALPALEECRRVVAEHPEYADWQYRRSVLAGSLGLLTEAREAIESALATNPTLGKGWHQLALLLRRSGDDRAACDALRRAAAASAEASAQLCRQAELLAEAGLFGEAATSWLNAIRFVPDYASRHIEIGRKLFTEGKLGEAERELEAGLSMAPQYADGHYYLGLICMRHGHPAEAIAYFKSSLELGPSNAQAGLELAAAYLADGNRAAAQATLRQWNDWLDGHHDVRVQALRKRAGQPEPSQGATPARTCKTEKTAKKKERTKTSETGSARAQSRAPRRRKKE